MFKAHTHSYSTLNIALLYSTFPLTHTLTAAAVLLQSVLCVLRRPFHVNSVVAKLNPGFAQQAVNHQTAYPQCPQGYVHSAKRAWVR